MGDCAKNKKESAHNIIAICKLIFENDDEQFIYLDKIKRISNIGKVECRSTNSMGHYSFNIKTNFNLETIFSSEKLEPYDIDKPIIEYTGYNKFGNIIYQAVAKEKSWVVTPQC